jgi:hypothetical protein
VNPARPDDARPGSWEWTVCGASVTGAQHLSKGLGCDDAFAYGVIGDFVVAVVADGAGSVTGTSAWGSYAACQHVLNAVMGGTFVGDFRTATTEDGDTVMRWLFDGALAAVTAQAEQMGLPVAQLATTLCVAVARPGLAVFGQIGDGIIATEDGSGISTVLIEDKGDYANTTWFIQSKEAFDESFRIAVRKELGAFALSTDGMAYKITNIVTGEAYEPFFKSAWENVEAGASASDFAAMLRGIKDDQTGDDKTMVLSALRWQDDQFHPSARPVQVAMVSSPAPPAIPAAPRARAPEEAERPQAIIDNGELVDLFAPGLDEPPARPPAHTAPRTRERRDPAEQPRRASNSRRPVERDVRVAAEHAGEPRAARRRRTEPEAPDASYEAATVPKRRWRNPRSES